MTEADAPSAGSRDATSGVRIPPPLFYLAGFGAGIALELAFPLDRPRSQSRLPWG